MHSEARVAIWSLFHKYNEVDGTGSVTFSGR